MSLKTNYKNDAFEGKRKYLIQDNGNGTWSIEDITQYAVTGDIFNADDINATNKAVNTHETKLSETEQSIASLDESLTKVQNVTLLTAGWSASAPYKQTVAISGMKQTDAPTPGLIYPANMTVEQKQLIDKCSDMITDMETFEGCLEVTCKFSRPTVDLIIGLKGR